MQLPAFGRRKSINLLPKDSFESSTAGVVLEWALAFGKWAVVLTQLVVMGAFLYRFTLDRTLTDMRKEMAQSAAVITSYEKTEQDFLLMQRRVDFAQKVLTKQDVLTGSLDLLQNGTPSDVWYERMTLTPDSLSISAFSGSLNGFGELLSNLQRYPQFTTVNIGSIEDGGAKGARLKFTITLGIKGDKK